MPAASIFVRTPAGRIRFGVVLLAVNVLCAVVAVTAVGAEHEPPFRVAAAWLIALAAVGLLRFGWTLTYYPGRRPGAWEWVWRCGTFDVGFLILLFAGSLVVDVRGGTGVVDAGKFGAVVTGETEADVHHQLGDPHQHIHLGGTSQDCDAYELLPMEAWGEIRYVDGRVVSIAWSEAPCSPAG
jgi:hypothetical protein